MVSTCFKHLSGYMVGFLTELSRNRKVCPTGGATFQADRDPKLQPNLEPADPLKKESDGLVAECDYQTTRFPKISEEKMERKNEKKIMERKGCAPLQALVALEDISEGQRNLEIPYGTDCFNRVNVIFLSSCWWIWMKWQQIWSYNMTSCSKFHRHVRVIEWSHFSHGLDVRRRDHCELLEQLGTCSDNFENLWNMLQHPLGRIIPQSVSYIEQKDTKGAWWCACSCVCVKIWSNNCVIARYLDIFSNHCFAIDWGFIAEEPSFWRAHAHLQCIIGNVATWNPNDCWS